MRELAKELRASGLSYAKIGERVGASVSTVHCWLNPLTAAKKREYEQSDKSRAKRREYQQSERRRVSSRKYKQSEKGCKSNRKSRLKCRKLTNHPEVTYVIGSLGYDRVVIGTTKNWIQRSSDAYGKSIIPLRLLGMTRLPEKLIHEQFQHLQVSGYSREVFNLTPELQAFIQAHCWPELFRYSECFVGHNDTNCQGN
jgi:predicted transcriptional regulator